MRIGVFCSGGDAPGMNPCVRAVVRAGIAAGHEIIGICRGYEGLLNEDFYLCDGQPRMTLSSVFDWIRVGGTRLHSSRSDGFRTEAGQETAADTLRRHDISALIPIGGDGTFHGAVALKDHWDGQIIGCPGTIDNDLIGTDFTIGFATAVQTAVDAVDKIRDTVSSHERMFLIEVMGRHSGYIAVYTALATGAETVCIPETPTDIDRIISDLRRLKNRGKTSIMMIVAEGDEEGGAEVLNQRLNAAGCAFPSRVAILGHLQRGGSPAAADRILGTQLGRWAIKAIDDGHCGAMVGNVAGQCTLTPFQNTFASHKPIPSRMLEIVETLGK